MKTCERKEGKKRREKGDGFDKGTAEQLCCLFECGHDYLMALLQSLFL